MQKFILIVLAIFITVFTVFSKRKERTPSISGGTSIVVSPNTPTIQISTDSAGEKIVTGEELIRQFIQKINEKKIAEAIALMDDMLLPTEVVKQEYEMTFQTFTSITIQSIEPVRKEEWNEGTELYRVDLMVSIKPEQKSLWNDGLNTRWITVIKRQNEYKIRDIATSP